jgi:hypothetical protein
MPSTGSRYVLLCLLLLVVASAAGCAAVTGIFKAGMWVGVILAVVVIVGGLALFSRLRG